MPLYLTSATNSPVTLQEVMASRDARQTRQQVWLTLHADTLVSFTIVAPGPIKDSLLTRQIFNHGCRALREQVTASGWEIVRQASFPLKTGPEGMIVINAPAIEVKQVMIKLEQSCLLGRLWDLDVFSPQGQLLSRKDFDIRPRKCLICDKDAVCCARKKTHPLPTIIAYMEELLNDFNRKVSY